MKIFSIFGYGVPKNILKDENYNRYLSFCFNKIFDLSRGEKAVIIFSGGPTDCYRPYKRTEAGEIKKLFTSLMERKFVKSETRNWKLVVENKPISGLENILFTVGYLKKNNIKKAEVYVFCEITREKRIKILLSKGNREDKKLKNIKFIIIPVDFDLSSNRYLNGEFLEKKERKILQAELKAIKSRKNFDEYRKWHEKKLEFFRENNYASNPKVVEKWWRKNL